MADFLRQLSESEEKLERRKTERRTFWLAVIGTITGVIGAITGLVALLVTVARG